MWTQTATHFKKKYFLQLFVHIFFTKNYLSPLAFTVLKYLWLDGCALKNCTLTQHRKIFVIIGFSLQKAVKSSPWKLFIFAILWNRNKLLLNKMQNYFQFFFFNFIQSSITQKKYKPFGNSIKLFWINLLHILKHLVLLHT